MSYQSVDAYFDSAELVETTAVETAALNLRDCLKTGASIEWFNNPYIPDKFHFDVLEKLPASDRSHFERVWSTMVSPNYRILDAEEIKEFVEKEKESEWEKTGQDVEDFDESDDVVVISKWRPRRF